MTDLKLVFANKLLRRLNVARSQIMQLPSELRRWDGAHNNQSTSFCSVRFDSQGQIPYPEHVQQVPLDRNYKRSERHPLPTSR